MEKEARAHSGHLRSLRPQSLEEDQFCCSPHAGASALWVRWRAHGLDLQLEPLSTESTARGLDPSLDTNLGQTQKGTSSEAFPPCVMALGRWVTPSLPSLRHG